MTSLFYFGDRVEIPDGRSGEITQVRLRNGDRINGALLEDYRYFVTIDGETGEASEFRHTELVLIKPTRPTQSALAH